MPDATPGSCRCGATTFELRAAPLLTSACHCRGCQRMTAAPYSLTALVPADAFALTAGEPVIGGLKDPSQQHHFCPECLSWLYTQVAGAPFVNVRAVLLDGPRFTVPYIETMTRERLAWVRTPAQHSFAGFPAQEELEALVAGYAAWRQAAP